MATSANKHLDAIITRVSILEDFRKEGVDFDPFCVHLACASALLQRIVQMSSLNHPQKVYKERKNVNEN